MSEIAERLKCEGLPVRYVVNGPHALDTLFSDAPDRDFEVSHVWEDVTARLRDIFPLDCLPECEGDNHIQPISLGLVELTGKAGRMIVVRAVTASTFYLVQATALPFVTYILMRYGP